MNPPSAFTGRSREHKTRSGVRVADVVSRWTITIGGIGTILAVLTVALFLIWVVLPLFLGAKATPVIDSPNIKPGLAPLQANVDEYRTIGWALYADGTLTTYRLDDGTILQQAELFGQDSPAITCVEADAFGEAVAIGFDDGTFRLGSIGFSNSFKEIDEVPDSIKDMAVGQSMRIDNDMVQRTPEGQFRYTHVELTFEPPIDADESSEAGIDKIALAPSSGSPILVVLTSDGKLLGTRISKKKNLLTGKITTRKRQSVLPYDASAHDNNPAFMLLNDSGDKLTLAWPDGTAQRIAVPTRGNGEVLETIDLVKDANLELTQLTYLLGRRTLIAGDSAGGVQGFFTVEASAVSDYQSLTRDGNMIVFRKDDPAYDQWKRTGQMPDDSITREEAGPAGMDLIGPTNAVIDGYLAATPPDQSRLVAAKTLVEPYTIDSPVTAIGPSARSRVFAVGYANGTVKLFHMTSANNMWTGHVNDEDQATGKQQPIHTLVMAPKDDALLAMTDTRMHEWSVDLRYPEASVGSLFGKVWYESYPNPQYVWQSSSGTDDAEPKLGLIPLIFGTLKATVYSMMFGAPIALLAAIYTSEFLNKKVKAKIKPTIELMASLPSVVLGFLAGLIIAPWAEHFVPAVLASFYLVPLSLLIGAFIWQLFPYKITIVHQQWRIVLMLICLLLSLATTVIAGPILQNVLFEGDFKRWTNGLNEIPNFGSGVGGWLFILTPLSALVVSLLVARVVNPAIRAKCHGWSREKCALISIVKFIAGLLATLLVALVTGVLLNGMGFDPRGSLTINGIDLAMMNTYIQRNALIVGFIMGFAIIPIIYTISEDALSTVPEHLRSASLGAGATPWQTAMRVIIPTAMSGLFSAMMIGLGRAVGETMIVLMAAGNTPVLDFNIFNGFRTLSANIAVELPEAVVDSTHYRTLFLAALTLFAMTFVVNTIAEFVRQRFRKRAYQL